MKISELIAELTAIQEQFGPDLEVESESRNGYYIPVAEVFVAFIHPTCIRLLI